MGRLRWTGWLYWFSLAFTVVLVYKTLDSFTAIWNWLGGVMNLLMPFIIAILIAYIFYIPARKLEGQFRKSRIKLISKKARVISVLTIYLITFVIITLVIKFILPVLSTNVKDLLNNLPGYYESARTYINELPEDAILSKIGIKDGIANLGALEYSQFIKFDNISGAAIEGVKGITSFIFNFFVALIVSIYLLLERTEILEFVKKLTGAMFRRKTNKRLGSYFRKTNEIFYKFISSQVLDAVVIGTIISIALVIMKVKYGVLLGLMIGLLNIIPYFGAIIGVIIAVLITIFTGGLGQAFVMTIVVVILQQIDANIINPKIVGNSLKLSPILIIFAVTVGGAYFGILGMFLAVPIIAMLKILVLDYIELKNLRNSRFIKNI